MKNVSATLAPSSIESPSSLATRLFHDGEREAQERVGVVAEANAGASRGIREYMPEQHRTFFSSLPFMILAGVDAGGQPWSTIRAGRPGFVSSSDNHTLHIQGGALPGDPLAGHWTEGTPIGGLGIQPHTRRRNRVNGIVTHADSQGLTIRVQQSFGNCPKYITRREALFTDASPMVRDVTETDSLSDQDRRLISTADTFFVASANLLTAEGMSRGVDVSHRGGPPGFVRVESDGSLTMADYAGNNYFNTIGNLLRNPRAGLLFIDFENGDVLHLATRADITWDAVPLAAQVATVPSGHPCAKRLVRFRIDIVRRVSGALPLQWISKTSETVPAADRVKVPPRDDVARRWRDMQIIEVNDESSSVRSFLLQPCDGQPLQPFEAGQFLPVRAVLIDARGRAPTPVPTHERAHESDDASAQGLNHEPMPDSTSATTQVVRNYTLSSAKDATLPRAYRISVKRGGAFSNWLHDTAAVGTRLEALPPRGDFTLDTSSSRPIVLMAAGIGITPMLALLEGVRRTDADRTVHLFYGTRDFEDSAFSTVLQKMADADEKLSLYFFESALERDMPGVRRFAGRLDSDALRRFLPFDGYDFYLCGPQPFMQALHAGLRALDVPDARIFSEAFGPSRLPSAAAMAAPLRTAMNDDKQGAAEDVPVTFHRAGRTASWFPSDHSLLGTVERCGLYVASSCQAGVCGTCATRVLGGAVEYDTPPDAEIDVGHALLCVARPSAQGVTLDL